MKNYIVRPYRLTMDPLVNVLLAIDKGHTMPQRVMDRRPGAGGLNQVYGPNHPTTSAWSICCKYNNTFTRCTYRNQFDILMIAVSDVTKGQTDMPYQGEH